MAIVKRPVIITVIGGFFIAGAGLLLLWAVVTLSRPSSQRYQADAWSLRAQAVAEAEAGDWAAAAKSFELAVRAAERGYEPIQVLLAIAAAQVETGNRAGAAQTFDRAAWHAMSLGLSDRGTALRGIAVTRARAGDVAGARRTAASIEHSQDRSRALGAVAAIEQALRVARSIRDTTARAQALDLAKRAESGEPEIPTGRRSPPQGKENVPFLLVVVAFTSFILIAAINFLRLRAWAKRALEYATSALVIVFGTILVIYIIVPSLWGHHSWAVGLAIAEISLLIMLLLLGRSRNAFESERAKGLQR